MAKRAIVLLAAVGLVSVGVWWCLRSGEVGKPAEPAPPAAVGKHPAKRGPAVSAGRTPKPGNVVVEAADGAGEEPTEEERDAAAEEAKVDAFDALTDRWMDPSPAGVTMKDVEAFVAAFRRVPKDRQDECVHRALNLVPDENVMLLAGILMDKSADREIVEAVFSDVLNRDEDVKDPILRQIFRDKSHPCWADTAWILDVTGDLQKGESGK